MTSAPAVGIIGVGTIGRALIAAFEGRTPLHLHDPALPDTRPMAELVARCQVVFLCVPTPMGSGEHADVTAVHDAVARFVTSGGAAQGAPILCVRSAVPPATIATVQRAHPGLRLVMAPEFLRQRAAVEDMLTMRTLVLGGAPADCDEVERLFREHSHVTGPMRTGPPLDAVAAAFLKYQANSFLAVKVSLMNEFHDLYGTLDTETSWTALQQAFQLDHERFGTTHWQVPGPDGQRGWGGACLPKDVAALRAHGRANAIETPVLNAAVDRNRDDRTR